MLISKKNRLAVYKFLFNEGVLVAKKDTTLAEHESLPGVSNLEVLKLMQSLRSRELVRETFNWQIYYYYLTDEGIEYLREYLALPATVAPETTKKPATTSRPAPGGRGGDRFSRDKRAGGDRPDFRRRDDGYRRDTGGFGRGRAMA